MKFDRRKLSHYLIYLIYLFNILTSFILSLLLFFKKRKKRIILFGHKLEGNIFYFLTSCKEFKYEVFYVSFSFAEYKNLKIKYSNILYALNILHVFKIIESTVLITTHGILFHSFFKNLLGMKTFNIGHGVTNVLNKVSPKEPDQLFDSHWLISNFEKTIIENDLGRKISNLEPTGFLRIDNLSSNISKIKKIKNEFKLLDKVGLYAPSGVEEYDFQNENNFQYQNIKFLELLNELCEREKITLIFKPHYFNYNYQKIEKDVISFVNSSSNIIYFEELGDSTTNEIMLASDFLITDYSSLFVDYLILKKPILFLEVKKRMDDYIYSEYFNNENINFMTTFQEFENTFNDLFIDSKNIKKLNDLKEIIFENKYQYNVLDKYKRSISEKLNVDLNEI